MASEGIPPLLAAACACWLTFRYVEPSWVPVPLAVLVALYLLFRDPNRPVPAEPLGVVSPVDGEVASIERVDDGILPGPAHRIVMRVDALGTYTARSPVEGRVLDLNAGRSEGRALNAKNALWVQTDEGDDVVLRFSGYPLGIPPRAITAYGERVGQGARCAYLRLVRNAELYVPVGTRLLVAPGQVLRAGSDLVGQLPHP